MASNKVATIAFLLILVSTVSSTCTPYPPPPPTPMAPAVPAPATCPDLKVCANLLGELLKVNLGLGSPQTKPCCSLIEGLVDLEAAVCLCATIKANVVGVVDVNIKLFVQLLLNTCGKKLPAGFECPALN